jgi:hypothetical protein
MRGQKMNAKKLGFYLLTILMGGCLPVLSLHPLFTEENIVFEPKLLGRWVDDPNDPETAWLFQRSEKSGEEYEKAYQLTFSDKDGKKGIFTAFLVKMDSKLFLDIFPTQFPSGKDDFEDMNLPFNSFLFVPAHTFVIVDSIEPKLKMRLTDDDDMNELLKETPDAIEHTLVDDRLILTASTSQLQSFILKYADGQRAFTNEVIMLRQEPHEVKKEDKGN